EGQAVAELAAQGLAAATLSMVRKVHLKYEGTDTALGVPFGNEMAQLFEAAYRKQFSFLMQGRALIVESISVEAAARGAVFAEPFLEKKNSKTSPAARVRMFSGGRWHEAPLFRREDLGAGERIDGPAIIAEANATTVIEPEWRAVVSALNGLILERSKAKSRLAAIGTGVDPVMLEIFNNLYM